MRPQQSSPNSSFGKRGRVEITPPASPEPQQASHQRLPTDTTAFKWIGGAIAAVFLMAVLSVGTGGGSLLGGILGGLLGAKLASKFSSGSTTAAAPHAAGAATAAQSTTMQRGGFGSTGGSSGSFSSGG